MDKKVQLCALHSFLHLVSPHLNGSNGHHRQNKSCHNCCWNELKYIFLVFLQFQTTAPKSCFMRPPGGILAPGESLIATGITTLFCVWIFLFLSSVKWDAMVALIYGIFITHVFWSPVFKFVEHPENNEKHSDQKSKVKFKIMSLKVKEGMDYVPELVSLLPT